ncbi:hypothetical protein ACEQ8H_002681 [Pleosporales sp. CAS-2024a]
MPRRCLSDAADKGPLQRPHKPRRTTRLENVDMSKLVSGHDRYKYLAGKILVHIGFGDVNMDKVAEQERALEAAERKKQRVKEEAKRKVDSEVLFEAPTHTASPSPIPNLMDDDTDEEKPKLPPRVNQTTFPTASALNTPQMPSRQIAETSAQSQPVRVAKPVQADSVDGPTRLMDAPHHATSRRTLSDAPKAGVAAEAPETEDSPRGQVDVYEDEMSDVESEFGALTLTMVDPVALVE